MGGISPRQTAGVGSLSQEREAYMLFRGGCCQSVIVVTHYRGRRGTLEEVITYNLGCSCVVVNNADANYFKRVGICSKLA